MHDSPWPLSDPSTLDPAETVLEEGADLLRVHGDLWDADAFNPEHGAGGRFHFIVREGKPSRKVPALYAAEGVGAALAESVFHDVPVRPRNDRRVAFSKLEGRVLSSIRTRRPLPLAELHHPGLGQLGLEPRDITDTYPSEYPRTRAWAQALHDAGGLQGLVWMSRLFNTERAYTFFGDRVSSDDFEITSDPVPLDDGPGLDLVYEHAEAADITIVHP